MADKWVRHAQWVDLVAVLWVNKGGMMGEPKTFASLSSGLLARKGGASPAMRRPVFGGANGLSPTAALDDLGWNDMGHDSHADTPNTTAVGLTPLPSSQLRQAQPTPVPIVVEQREALEARVAESIAPAEPIAPPAPIATRHPVVTEQAKAARRTAGTQRRSTKAKPDSAVRTGKAAFTLRLDPERHLKLRLSCAIENRSAQQIVTEALDIFLGQHPELDALANRIPRESRAKLI